MKRAVLGVELVPAPRLKVSSARPVRRVANSLRPPPRLDADRETSSPSSSDGILEVTPRHLPVAALGGREEGEDVGVDQGRAIDGHGRHRRKTTVGEQLGGGEEAVRG